MGIMVVLFFFITMFLLAAYFAYELHNEATKAMLLAIGGIISFFITAILVWKFIDFSS